MITTIRKKQNPISANAHMSYSLSTLNLELFMTFTKPMPPLPTIRVLVTEYAQSLENVNISFDYLVRQQNFATHFKTMT